MIVYNVSLATDTNIGFILNEQNYIRCVCMLLSKSIMVILVLTLNRVIVHKKTIRPLYIIIIGFSSAFLLVSNLVLIYSELGKNNEEISKFTIFFFIASLGIEMIIFGLVIKIAENYEREKTYSLIELNNKMLKKSLDETDHSFEMWRQSIHDYKNNIIVLRQMAEEGRLREIETYLQKESELLEKKVFYVKTGNSVVDTIINTKQNIAEKLNITFIVNVKLPQTIVISDIDIAGILGNLIDNAIEASKDETEPYVEINIKQKKNFLIINIKNKFTKLVDIDGIKTNKSNSEFHGIGLRSVRKTAQKYDGQVDISIKNEEFVANILLRNGGD